MADSKELAEEVAKAIWDMLKKENEETHTVDTAQGIARPKWANYLPAARAAIETVKKHSG